MQPRAEVLAYAVYVLLVCALFSRLARDAVAFGSRLDELKQVCRTLHSHVAAEKKPPAFGSVHTLVADKRDDVLQSSSSEDAEVVWSFARHMPVREVAFRHLPDLHDAHTIAIFRIDTAERACVSFIAV